MPSYGRYATVDPRLDEPVGIRLALVAQRVELRGDDDGGRDAAADRAHATGEIRQSARIGAAAPV